MRFEESLEHQLHATTTGLSSVKTRRHHAGIVEDEMIAGLQQRGKIRKAAVFASLPVEHQQATAAARGKRHLRNEFSGKLVAVVGERADRWPSITRARGIVRRAAFAYTSVACRGGGIGRHAGFKIRFRKRSESSSLSLGTSRIFS